MAERLDKYARSQMYKDTRRLQGEAQTVHGGYTVHYVSIILGDCVFLTKNYLCACVNHNNGCKVLFIYIVTNSFPNNSRSESSSIYGKKYI